jgi:hypothetical protein
MNEELSPWPITVSVAQDVFVTVTGVSSNSYVVNNRIGLESPTTACEENVELELPALWQSYQANQLIDCPPDVNTEIVDEA